MKDYREFLSESFNQPYYEPTKLDNSRITMLSKEEIENLGKHQGTGGKNKLKKLLDKVTTAKGKIEQQYNKEQETLGRADKLSSLDSDLVNLRSYIKIINYFL